MSADSPVAEPQMNATPLIDVMLVLLVVMFITLPVATHSTKLNLPQGPAAPPPASVRIDLFYDGSIYWNDERIESVAALTPRFENVARQANPPLINLVPEKRTHYDRVLKVLAAAQRSHVVNMSVAPLADPGTL